MCVSIQSVCAHVYTVLAHTPCMYTCIIIVQGMCLTLHNHVKVLCRSEHTHGSIVTYNNTVLSFCLVTLWLHMLQVYI